MAPKTDDCEFDSHRFYQIMKEKVLKYLEAKKEIDSELEGWVKDKSTPLNERWDVFILMKSGSRSGWMEDFKTLNDLAGEVSWYDDFHLEKHETMDMERLVEHVAENIDETGEYALFDGKVTEKVVEDLQEEILEKFIWSFKFDW